MVTCQIIAIIALWQSLYMQIPHLTKILVMSPTMAPLVTYSKQTT